MAKNFNKPISKLSLFFIFSILIPGCILTYFSIQTIANQKELTEKRLIEEQNELSAHMAGIFQQQLLECASKFFNQVDSFSPQFQKLHFIDDSMDCVAQAFVVDSDGQFMWPHYFQGSSFPNQKSEVFSKTFAQAEKLEFAKSDLKSAALSYQQALAKAKNLGGRKMKRQQSIVILLVALLISTSISGLTQTPSQLYQQALLKENGEGDLKAAVAIYEKIVGDVTADWGTRAKAQLYIKLVLQMQNIIPAPSIAP